MRHRRATAGALSILVVCILAGASASAQTRRAYGGVRPFFFEPNVGQASPAATFVARGRGYRLEVAPTEAALVANGTTLRMRFAGARQPRSVIGVDRLPGTSSYFRGNDRFRWRRGVPTFAKVHVAGLYRGIDLVYYGTDGALEYDLIVAPGADPSVISLAFSGEDGLRIDADGDLMVSVAGRDVRHRRPFIYQDAPGGRRAITGRYVIDPERRVRFKVGAYDTSRPLVIDPILLYSGYLGGTARDVPAGVAVDGSGSAYIAGITPATGLDDADVFLVKLDPTGSFVLYSVILGGSRGEDATSVGVDAAGSAYIAGITISLDFPTRNAIQPRLHTLSDGFVAKLNASGTDLVYSTYLGGNGLDEVRGLAVRPSGQIALVGASSSDDFPLVNPVQSTMAGWVDAYVAVLNPSGSALVFSTYLGGGTSDFANGVAIDGEGNVIVTGMTVSSNFPVVQAFQPVYGGNTDAFVSKFEPGGWTLVYSTFLGGKDIDAGAAVGVGPSGMAVACGATYSPDFPIVAALQDVFAARLSAAYVTKLDRDGTPIYSTYLSGGDSEGCGGVAVDAQENAFIAGGTTSANFPLQDPIQDMPGGLPRSDAFIATINASGASLLFSSYLGGSTEDYAIRIAIDNADSAYVVGYTESDDFPVTPFAAQRTFGGTVDAWVAKIGPACGTDVTDEVDVGAVLSIPIPLTPWRIELLLVRNHGVDPIGGPLSVVLADLRNAILVNSLFTTECTGAGRTPFVIVPPGPDGFLSPGEIVGTWLLFYQTDPAAVSYRPLLLSGVPVR